MKPKNENPGTAGTADRGEIPKPFSSAFKSKVIRLNRQQAQLANSERFVARLYRHFINSKIVIVATPEADAIINALIDTYELYLAEPMALEAFKHFSVAFDLAWTYQRFHRNDVYTLAGNGKVIR